MSNTAISEVRDDSLDVRSGVPGTASVPPNDRYDQRLRLQVDRMLQLRAGVGGNIFILILIWGVWVSRRELPLVLAVCLTFVSFATVFSRMVCGTMDRTVPNIGFFVGNSLYAIGAMAASDFSPESLFIIPLVTLFYDGFSEGETRLFVLAMLALLGGVPLLLGVPAVPVVAAVVVAFLIHWFSEGRARTLRAAIADVKSTAQRLRLVNEQLQVANQKLAEQGKELRANYEALGNAQARLLQSEKLAGIGQLAAGIAHEVNNPLAVILGFAQGLTRRVDRDSPLHLPVSSIAREAFRCQNLVQELLTFSRVAKRSPERVTVNTLLRGTAQLLESRAREQRVNLELDLGTQQIEIQANATQLQQVVVNLGNNALDAMAPGGTLRLCLSKKGDHGVAIEVTDTGSGIPEAIREKIFEPFFTTKEVGKGTGLGLSLAYEIVTQHGGKIEVDSQTGCGTKMIVCLPVGSEQVAA